MTANGTARPVILDRDGTVIIDRQYLDDPAQIEFLPGAVDGLRRLSESSRPIIIVTNQSGVGRGRFTLARMHEVNDRLIRMASDAGIRIDAIYSCPHGPEEDCACRKPGTQLVLEAAGRFGFDPASAIVVGDKSTDIELGRRLHAITILISTDGRAADEGWVEPDYVLANLRDAARVIERIESAR